MTHSQERDWTEFKHKRENLTPSTVVVARSQGFCPSCS